MTPDEWEEVDRYTRLSPDALTDEQLARALGLLGTVKGLVAAAIKQAEAEVAGRAERSPGFWKATAGRFTVTASDKRGDQHDVSGFLYSLAGLVFSESHEWGAEFPEDVAAYLAIVERCLGAGAKLKVGELDKLNPEARRWFVHKDVVTGKTVTVTIA